MNRCIVFVTLLFLTMSTCSLAAEEVATQREAVPIPPQSVLPAVPSPAVQSPAGAAQASQQGMTMNCPKMGGMGGGMMGGTMSSMGGGTTANMSGMSHNMAQGLGMKDIMQIMTMQDTLQIVTEMLKIQEQIAEGTTGARSARLKRDIEELRGRARQAMTDLKSFIAEQPR